MFLTSVGQNLGGLECEAERTVGGQGEAPGGPQGAWDNGPCTDPILPGLQRCQPGLAADTPGDLGRPKAPTHVALHSVKM